MQLGGLERLTIAYGRTTPNMIYNQRAAQRRSIRAPTEFSAGCWLRLTPVCVWVGESEFGWAVGGWVGGGG